MTLAQIKALFKTGAIPTQSDFESLKQLLFKFI
jgi:hypothetical protein